MTFTGVVKDFAGLVTCRIFLGIAEAGFFPGVWLSEVLHRWKKRTNHPCSMLSLLTHVPYRIWLSLTLPAPYFFKSDRLADPHLCSAVYLITR